MRHHRFLAAAVLAAGCGNGGSASPDAATAVDAPLPIDAPGPDAPMSKPATGARLTFESGPVRPVALSPDGTRLFVANTANDSLDILPVTDDGLGPAVSVAVGIDPVAVAARSDGEVWVVNQISDSVSIVDVSASPPRVVRTLLVGDEPSDIVFAGPGRGRAFITTAHRGQQRSSPSLGGVPGGGDPGLTTPGVGRADVWVFDAANFGDVLGGRPLAIVTVSGDTPRGLAVTPDGATVYAAVFKSGNQTTSTLAEMSCPGFDNDTPCTVSGTMLPGAPPGPAMNHAGVPAPRVGLILKMDGAGAWRDVKGRDFSAAVRFTLPDEDVFAIDADKLSTTASYRHVGTTLFNLAVNPKSGKVYVSNTEARNDLRFEGPGLFAGTSLQGHLAEARITVLDGDAVRPRHLNKHIDYAVRPAPAGVKEHSLAMPLGLAVSADGATLYVAAFGSAKVGVFPTAALEDDSFDPTTASAGYLAVSGGGPSGLALDEARHRLYVATRFDDGVSVVDLDARREIGHVRLASLDPEAVARGRHILYDAFSSSSNGEASCASCHMFGDGDHLAWDLGNPDGDTVYSPINVRLVFGVMGGINGTGDASLLHPMKGPMSTQTLRGMVNHGPMHWRGDRVNGYFGVDTRTEPPFNSELAFKNFIVAFDGLLGGAELPTNTTMQDFSDFALAIVMPPNPVRALDNSLSAAQERGRQFYMGCAGLDSGTGMPVTCNNGRPVGLGHFSDGVGLPGLGFTCEGCHTLRPADGFFGTDGQSSFEALPQIMKIPQLRNLYDKVGMFGLPANPEQTGGDHSNMGAQIRGFGFQNDAAVDTLLHFLQANVFNSRSGGRTGFFGGDDQRRDVEQFLLAFDSDLAPIVGQQVTLDAQDANAAGPRIDLLIARAMTPFASQVLGAGATECDLVARGVIGGRPTVFRLRADGRFAPDDGGDPLADAALRALAQTPGQALTYTCLPPGWSARGQ
jgi:DNA-binding beta-propeller fold protein YncE